MNRMGSISGVFFFLAWFICRASDAQNKYGATAYLVTTLHTHTRRNTVLKI